MERLFHAYDCRDNLIFFDRCLSNDKKNLIKLTTEQYVKMLKTFSAPAIIIESNNNNNICRTRYYFRAICWDKTLLIAVNFSDGIWKVNGYFENPSGFFVLTLLKNNLLNGKINLIQQNEISDSTIGFL